MTRRLSVRAIAQLGPRVLQAPRGQRWILGRQPLPSERHLLVCWRSNASQPPKKEDPKPAGSGASGSASSERPLKKEDPKPSGSGTNSTSSASSAPGAGASGSSTGHPHLRELYDTSSRQMHTQMERLSKIYRNVQLSYTFLTIGGGALALGIGYVIINWTMLRSQAAQESAEVVSQTMQNAQVQFSAREFSKELLNQLFNDDEIATTVASWTLRLLTSIQQEIGALFVHILQQQQVVDEVNRLADKLVAYLCESQTIQERVGGLLVDAINLQSSRDAAALWAYDLVMREDVTCGFRDLVVTALQMDAVVEEAQQLAVQVVNRVLSDEKTIDEAKRVLREALEDQELRNSAKESLWNIVLPWSSRSPDELRKTLRSAEDLVASPFLTEEERSFLRSLQARLKESARRGSPEPKKSRTEHVEEAHSAGQAQQTEVTPPVAAGRPEESPNAPETAPQNPEVLKALKGPEEPKRVAGEVAVKQEDSRPEK
ncbi:Hypothetical protein SCF082_LOCUS11651 [Durusdinium trenchii]|uniref:Uncharacterized protein n=1 Tax=Durusdinium trenchii TaxID=1381693 RepID=A0ABP0JEL9_9DINO